MGVISEAIPSVRLEEFITWSNDEVTALDIEARFRAIKLLVAYIYKHSPVSKDDPLAPVCEKKFGPHIQTLEKLAKSIQFSDYFDQKQQDVVEQTLSRLSDTQQTITCIEEWRDVAPDYRENVLCKLNTLRYLSTRDVFGFVAREPEMRFARIAKNREGRVALGEHIASLCSRRFNQYIIMNTHPDSQFDDGIRTFCNTYHESGGHDNQFALAYNLEFGGGRSTLGPLLPDAEISRLRYVFGASIPPRIKNPSFYQCHEIDAERQEFRFERGLLALLGKKQTQPRIQMIAKCE